MTHTTVDRSVASDNRSPTIKTAIKFTHQPREKVEAWRYDGQPREEWPDWIRAHYCAGNNPSFKGWWAVRDSMGYLWRWFDPDQFRERYEPINTTNSAPAGSGDLTKRMRLSAKVAINDEILYEAADTIDSLTAQVAAMRGALEFYQCQHNIQAETLQGAKRACDCIVCRAADAALKDTKI